MERHLVALVGSTAAIVVLVFVYKIVSNAMNFEIVLNNLTSN